MTPREQAVIDAAKAYTDADHLDGQIIDNLLNACDGLAVQPPKITIWRFADAPQEYRDLWKREGSQPDSVTFAPDTFGYIPHDWPVFGGFAYWQGYYEQHAVDSGYIVFA